MSGLEFDEGGEVRRVRRRALKLAVDAEVVAAEGAGADDADAGDAAIGSAVIGSAGARRGVGSQGLRLGVDAPAMGASTASRQRV